jgi:hypothetical protein
MAVVLGLAFTRVAAAEEVLPQPEEPLPPEGFGAKQHLRADDLLGKKEAGYFTGLPLANYDPTTRYGFGGRVYYYWNGHRDDPFFAYTPYLDRIIFQAFGTTAGAQEHLIDWDAPAFLGSLFRARATLEYDAARTWPYFGTGSRSMAPLAFPGAPGATFSKFNDYDDAAHRVQPDGTTYGLYNSFGFQRPTLQLGIERLFFGGIIRPFIGVGLSYSRVTDRTGDVTDATDAGGNSVQAPEAQTLLAQDCAAQRIVGCEGGWDNVLRLALSIDTRDFEPDPNSGIYSELSTEFGTKALGSHYTYSRAMLSVRGFFSPIPHLADLVLAGRALYEIQSTGTPFTSMSILPFIDDNHAGLGGLRTLRGFQQNRFVGPIIALTNYEVRWTFTHFRLFNQGFALIAVPFVDIGRVFDNVKQTTLAGWKRTQGVGLRIGWNEATIIMLDFGVSEEGTGLYANFNHIF